MYISGTFEDVPVGKQSWRDHEMGRRPSSCAAEYFSCRAAFVMVRQRVIHMMSLFHIVMKRVVQ